MEKIRNQKLAPAQPWSAIVRARAFTLIELLVVIAIIGVLAAFIIPTLKAVKRNQYLSNAKAELALMESAIEAYKSTYGFYPPNSTLLVNNIPINPLYYELLGTTNNNGTYQTLDGSAQPISLTSMTAAFNLGGFINCTKPGAGEDAAAAKNFLPDLKPNQYGVITNGNNIAVTELLCSVGGPDPGYRPFGVSDLNPWRYSYPGTNNSGGYDLYVQLVISGKTNLVCNWSKQVQINNPLP